MSKGGVLKSGWVVVNPADTRIIDSNALAEVKLKEMAAKLALQCGEEPEFTDGFMQGLNAVQVSELVGSDEMNGEAFAAESSPEQMQDMNDSGAVALQAEQLIAEAQAQIEEMKAQALEEIEQTKAKVLEEAKQTGYEEGLKIGKEEGFESGRQEGLESLAEQKKKMLGEIEYKVNQIEEQYQKKFNELEPKFIETLTGIYEHIFHVNLKNSRELIVYLIQNTMRNVEGSNSYLIHVSKDDYPFASMQKKELVKNTNISIEAVEIIEDATLGRNECMIETGNGVFDCSLGTQLEALNEQLRLLSYEQSTK